MAAEYRTPSWYREYHRQVSHQRTSPQRKQRASRSSHHQGESLSSSDDNLDFSPVEFSPVEFWSGKGHFRSLTSGGFLVAGLSFHPSGRVHTGCVASALRPSSMK